MGLHPPIVHRPPPPPDAAELARRAQHQAEIERQRAERDAQEAVLRPRRRELLETCPGLRDLDAALTCMCACHPRPADPTLHDGGASCRCQLTPEERAAAFDTYLELSAEFRDEQDAYIERRDAAFAAEVARLGVTARITVGAMPLVIVGEVDGRAFMFRERHDEWRVQISPDGDPLGDPQEWEHTIRIASGGVDELQAGDHVGEVGALRVAVYAVREALLRNSCAHEAARHATHRYCSLCGVPLDQTDDWRWST